MTDKPQENVHEYRRERLEPEIAAMSVETEEADNPMVIVNVDDPAAKSAIKKVIGWLGVISGIGWLIKWAQRSARRQLAVAVASTAAVAATAAAVVVVEAAQNGETRPPATAERVVTLPASPPVTVTVTPSPDPTAPPAIRDTPPHERSHPRLIDVADRPTPSRASSVPVSEPTRPRRRRTPPPATRASAPPPVQAEAAEPGPPSRDVDSPASTTAPTVSDSTPEQPTTGPEPTPPPPSVEPEPTLAAAGCDGLVEVDLDPLLDLCLLG